jgi:phage head maturation protease
MQIKTTIPVSVSSPDPSTLNVGTPDSGPSTSSYCLDFISSDASTDRHTEAINPSGWKLDNYRRNPVFQNSHQYGDILFTLGKASVTEVRDVAGRKALFQRIEFACDVNPMAKIAHGLYKGGFLSGVSVGFVPLKWQDVPSGRNADLQSAVSQVCNLQPDHKSNSSQSPRRVYLEQELLEVSAVAIPANPNALALAYKSGAVEKSDLRELSTLLNCTLSAYEVPASAGPVEDPNCIFLERLNAVLRKT